MKNNILVIGKGKTGTTVISKTIQHSLHNANYFLEPKEICFFESRELQDNHEPKIVKIIYDHWITRPRLLNAIVYNETKLKFEKIVCIKRDLRDEIISRLFYIIFPYTIEHGFKKKLVKQWIEIVAQKEKSPNSISTIEMINKYNELFPNSYNLSYVINLASLYTQFLNNHFRKFCIVEYENFINRNLNELETYLDFQLSKNNSVDDLERTKRSTNYNNWKRYFTHEDIDYFQDLIGEILEKQGYKNWDLENTAYLNPDHGSNYIKRILKL